MASTFKNAIILQFIIPYIKDHKSLEALEGNKPRAKKWGEKRPNYRYY